MSASIPARPPIEELRQRIHVGCGPKSLKSEWWNVDIRAFPGVDEVCDITQPWGDLSGVTHVYGEHFLEHLALGQALDFLTHARGALAQEGRLRLTTPSLEWVISTHFDPSGDDQQVIDQTYGVNRAFRGWGHQFLWSRPMLVKTLTALGYADIIFCTYGESDDPMLQGVEQHGGYTVAHGFPSVWIVEANKGIDGAEEAQEFRQTVREKFLRYVESGH
jgi:hypothetical protein